MNRKYDYLSYKIITIDHIEGRFLRIGLTINGPLEMSNWLFELYYPVIDEPMWRNRTCREGKIQIEETARTHPHWRRPMVKYFKVKLVIYDNLMASQKQWIYQNFNQIRNPIWGKGNLAKIHI